MGATVPVLAGRRVHGAAQDSEGASGNRRRGGKDDVRIRTWCMRVNLVFSQPHPAGRSQAATTEGTSVTAVLGVLREHASSRCPTGRFCVDTVFTPHAIREPVTHGCAIQCDTG